MPLFIGDEVVCILEDQDRGKGVVTAGLMYGFHHTPHFGVTFKDGRERRCTPRGLRRLTLRKGDVVTLSPESKWANDGRNNPLNVNGVVLSNNGDKWDMDVKVSWAAGSRNTYREEDLILQEEVDVREPVPAPEPRITYDGDGGFWRQAAAEFKNPDMVFTEQRPMYQLEGWDDNAKPAPRAKKPAPVKKKQIKTSMVIQGKEFTFTQDELRELEEQFASHII